MAEEAAEERDEELDAQRDARRRAALAQIRQYGDPVLRMATREVVEFDGDLARLVDRMKRLMAEANGVGLAANQVGVLRRVLVLVPGAEQEAVGIVNPRITVRSDETEIDGEGCLSLQGVLVPVERNVGITIEGRDLEGMELRLDLRDLGARVAQHEVDHLDGVLVLDRTTDESRREALGVLRPRLVLG